MTVVQVIAEHLSVEEVEIIREMFALMDTDKDGKVTYEELKTGLRKVGSQLAEPEIRLLMDVADVDGNGVLEYGEFVAVTIHLREKLMPISRILPAFYADRLASSI